MRCATAAEPICRRRLAGATLGLALLLAPWTARAQQAAATQEYVTIAGDTCAAIARTFWPTDPKAVDLFHALNPQLGPSPHKLRPGLRLSVALSAADARLTFLKPAVKKKPSRAPEWKPAAAGDDLFRLDEVNTLQGAGAEVTFRDATSLQLDENALIVIYGHAQTPAQREKSGEVEIVQGEAGVNLAALRGEPLALQTPAARLQISSKSLRVSVDEKKMSRVSVYQGLTEVKAQGARVQVPDGFGTRVAEGAKPEEPRPLPDAPAWTNPLLRDLRLSLGGAGASLVLEWAAVERGARYRVQLARDAAFNDRLLDATLEAARPRRAEARALPPGNYFARVSAIDDKGLVGKASLVREVQVRSARADNTLQGPGAPATPDANGATATPGAPATPDATATGAATGPLRGVGELRFSLDPDLEVRLDGKPTPPVFTLRAPGKHEVQVALPGASADTIACEVLLPRATLTLEPTAAGALAKLTLLDPATGVVLHGRGGSQIGPPRASAQGLTAAVTPAGELASVEALYEGQRIAEASLRIEPPPPPEPARLPPAGLSGQPAALVAASPLPSPWLDRAGLLELRVQPEAGTPAARKAGSLGALALQVPTQWGALGASYTVQQNPVGASPLGQGSIWLLGELLPGPTALTAGLDLAFPGGGETQGALLSPRARALVSVGRQLGRLAFSTTQALALSKGQRALDTAAWDSAYLASARLTRRLALVAELDGVVGEGRSLAAFAGSVGARTSLGPIDLGASLRTGLFADGRYLWGQPALLLSATLRLPGLSLE